MPLTPDEARELLDNYAKTEANEEAEDLYIGWRVQAEIMKGDHADELAELHHKIMEAQVAGHPEDAAAEIARRQEIVDSIAEEWRNRVAEEGIPPAWQK